MIVYTVDLYSLMLKQKIAILKTPSKNINGREQLGHTAKRFLLCFTDASHIGLDQEEVAYDGFNSLVELSL